MERIWTLSRVQVLRCGPGPGARDPSCPAANQALLPPQDFGDYQDGYYSVQTTEGEQIAQLIAGYIDIILKKVKKRRCWWL